LETNLSQCHFIAYKSHQGSSPGIRGERLGLTKLELLIQVGNNSAAKHGPGKLELLIQVGNNSAATHGPGKLEFLIQDGNNSAATHGLGKLELLIQVVNNSAATHGPGKLVDRNMLTDRMHEVQYNETHFKLSVSCYMFRHLTV